MKRASHRMKAPPRPRSRRRPGSGGGQRLDDVGPKGREGEAARELRVEDRGVVTRQRADVREHALRRRPGDHVVGAAGVRVHRDRAVPIGGGPGVDHRAQERPPGLGGVRDQRGELGGLRVPAEAERPADRAEILGALVRAGEQDDRADAGELAGAALVDHPGEVPLQDEPALTVGDDHEGPGGVQQREVAAQGVRDVVVVGDAGRRQRQAHLRRLVAEPVDPHAGKVGIGLHQPREAVPGARR